MAGGSYNRQQLQQIASQAANKYGIDQNIFFRQIGAESGWNVNARSPAGALGVAQFMPGTAKGMGVNPMDPKSALFGAARYMSNNLKQFNGNYRLALAAYNAGGGNARKALHSFPETQAYVKKIMGGYKPNQFGGAQGGAGSGSGPVSVTLPGAGHWEGGADQTRIAQVMRLRPDSRLANAWVNNYTAENQPKWVQAPGQTITVQGPTGGGAAAGAQGGFTGPINGGNYQARFRNIAKQFGLGWDSNAPWNQNVQQGGGTHTQTSLHYKGRAADFGTAKNSMQQLMQLARWARANRKQIAELHFDPLGWGIKNGNIYKGGIGGHGDHLHLAFR